MLTSTVYSPAYHRLAHCLLKQIDKASAGIPHLPSHGFPVSRSKDGAMTSDVAGLQNLIQNFDPYPLVIWLAFLNANIWEEEASLIYEGAGALT